MWGGYHLCWFRLSVLHCFGIEFLADGFVLTSIVCTLVAGVVMGIDGCMKRAVSPLHVRSM